MAVEKDMTLRVRITSSLDEAIGDAARRDRLTTPDWVRAVLARAVNKGAFGNWKVATSPKRGDRHGSRPKKKPA